MDRITTVKSLYDTDFSRWVEQTSTLLRNGHLDKLDIENLIEEIESLGRSEKNAIKENLRVLLMHLLKWNYQSSHRSRRWVATVNEHRNQIIDLLEDSPSLKGYCHEILNQEYQKARRDAAQEMQLDMTQLPLECEWSLELILTVGFLDSVVS